MICLTTVLPSYGTPQPYAPPPYITTSTKRVSLRTQQWSTGLCCCLDDPGNCLVTCFCPCVTFGLIAEIVDRGTSTCTCDGGIYGTLRALTGLACLYSCSCQSKLRVQYDLPEAPCMDCFVHFCCETCALCQEYRELKNHGFDLSIGSIGRRPKNPYALVHKADLPGLECEELKVMLEAGRLLHNRG